VTATQTPPDSNEATIGAVASTAGLGAGASGRRSRIRTVEHDPGWGWIARNPFTGCEISEDFRWASRSVARAVVLECRIFRAPNVK